MKGNRNIHHRPYIPYNRHSDAARPYICRLVPGADHVTLEWLKKEEGVHYLVIRRRGEENGRRTEITTTTVTENDLSENTEYELFIESPSGLVSNVRPFITSDVPEGATVINYLHPEDKQYAFSGNSDCGKGKCVVSFKRPWMCVCAARLRNSSGGRASVVSAKWCRL